MTKNALMHIQTHPCHCTFPRTPTQEGNSIKLQITFKRLIHFLLLLPVFAFGQYHITGKVVNILDKKPVAGASVFLSNASAGGKTEDDGTFDISNVRSGHYELVVTIIGYVTYHQNVVVNNDLSLPTLELEQRNIQLREVRIGPDLNWDRNYAMFKREFLGGSENAAQCKILNPQSITLKYDASKGELTGSSDDFIEIENRALGYKVKYLLNTFTKTYSNYFGGMLYYEGSAFFEDLKGSRSETRKWQKARLNAYMGSDMHFLRSVISNLVSEEGFVVRRLIRTPNPDYQHGSLQKYKEQLISTSLPRADYLRLTDQKGEYAFAFKDCLYITYHKKSTDVFPSSIISFKEPYIYFDNNGVIINPESAIMEDSWSFSRIAEMLPVDYVPGKK